MTPHPFTNLGGLDKPLDVRDIKIGTASAPVYTFLPTFTNAAAWSRSVEYQGQQPACGAHSGAGLEAVKRRSRFSPRFTWHDIKSFDGIPLDAGTDMRSIFKSITKDGVVDFALAANDVTGTLAQYANIFVTDHMKQSALNNVGFGYGFITDLTFSGLKQFIYDHGAVIILMRVGASMWTAPNGQTSWAENDILPLRPPTPVTGGHFVVAHSYDENNIYFLNSFSDAWGRKGHGFFTVNYMPYINDAGALFALSFTKDLRKGMTDPDVKRLQVVLNKDPRTQLAMSGAGSPGQETPYFGIATFGAVSRFQSLHTISPTGFVGPLTRAVLNSVDPA